MPAPHPSSDAKKDNPLRPLQRRGSLPLPKASCTSRSQWRVLPGKAPERLSPYYQLNCEFGSPLMLSWRDEGNEPVYLCEEHVKDWGNTADARASAKQPSGKTDREKQEKNDAIEAPPAAQPVAAPQKPPLSESKTAPPNANPSSEAPRKTTKPTEPPTERCAAVDRLISDLSAQLENVFSQSGTAISVSETIDAPLERAVLEVIGNESMTETQKDAAVQQLGALQESLKQDAGTEMTLLIAHRIKETVGNRLSGESSVVEEAKPGYRAVSNSLEIAIYAAAPRSRHLEQRLVNLRAMKAELENSPQAKTPAPAVA